MDITPPWKRDEEETADPAVDRAKATAFCERCVEEIDALGLFAEVPDEARPTLRSANLNASPRKADATIDALRESGDPADAAAADQLESERQSVRALDSLADAHEKAADRARQTALLRKGRTSRRIARYADSIKSRAEAERKSGKPNIKIIAAAERITAAEQKDNEARLRSEQDTQGRGRDLRAELDAMKLKVEQLTRMRDELQGVVVAQKERLAQQGLTAEVPQTTPAEKRKTGR